MISDHYSSKQQCRDLVSSAVRQHQTSTYRRFYSIWNMPHRLRELPTVALKIYDIVKKRNGTEVSTSSSSVTLSIIALLYTVNFYLII